MATNTMRSGHERAVAGAWGGPFVLGLLIMLIGVFCMAAAGFAGVASVVLFGALLVVAGVFEAISAFRLRGSGRLLLYLLAGVLTIVVGAVLLFRPMVGLAAITLLLAGYFLASGLFHGITALMDRYAGWGWDLFYAAVAVFLGVSILNGWPGTSLWVVGVVVGAEIAVRGIAVMAGSLQLRRTLRREVTGGAAA